MPAAARDATSATRPPISALELAEALGAPHGGGADHRCARGARLLPAARRGDPRGLPRLRAELAAQARPLGAERRDDRLLTGRRAPRRDDGAAADAARGLPRAARRDQHEAARAQAGRVHVGRPARLRGRRAPRTCSSTTRASSSRAATGSPMSSRSRGSTRARCSRSREELGLPGGDRDAGAHDRDLQPAPDPGGVLLRLSARADGRAAVGRTAQDGRPNSARVGPRRGGGRGRLRRDRAPPRGDRIPPRPAGARSTRTS